METKHDEGIETKNEITNTNWKGRFKILLISSLVVFSSIIFFFNSFISESLFTDDNKLSDSSLLLSKSLKASIDSSVVRSDIIIGIQVFTIDFQKNSLIETYISLDNPVVKEIYNSYLEFKVADILLFSNDRENNHRLIRLMNGEFICIPFIDSAAYRRVPAAGKYVAYVCSSNIPPYYGEFTGILTFYLKSAPNEQEHEALFALSRELSSAVYEENKHRYEE